MTRRFRQAESAAPRLLQPLKRALVECDQPLIDDLAATLIAVSADPERDVCEGFREDHEVRRRSLATLEELQRRASARPADEDKVKLRDQDKVKPK